MNDSEILDATVKNVAALQKQVHDLQERLAEVIRYLAARQVCADKSRHAIPVIDPAKEEEWLP